MMVETVKRLAEIRGTDTEHIAELTTRNFERLCLMRGGLH
jgi:Tat protein secretion system quality control protein TatD with DNase activity